MILAIVKGNKINKLFLPDSNEGNYIVKDYQNNVIGNFYAVDNQWYFDANTGYTIDGKSEGKSFLVENNQEIVVRDQIKNTSLYIYFYKTTEETIIKKKIKINNISIGSSGDISYGSAHMKGTVAKLIQNNNIWFLETVDNANVYVNDRLVRKKRIEHGDIIFSYGLKIVVLSENILIQSVNKNITPVLSNSAFEEYHLMPQQLNDNLLSIESDFETFTDDEQFMRSPRFRSTIKHEEVQITPPPIKKVEAQKPAILTVGPRLTMILTSLVGIITIFNNIATGKATLQSSILSIIVAVVTMVSSFLWPALSSKWQKHEVRRDELKRLKQYREYLKKKDKEISNIVELQRQILLENNITLEDCQLIIYNKKRNLWEKIIDDDDFLTVRLGIGKVKPDIAISWKEEDFAIDDDRLKEELKDMLRKHEYIDNVPLNLSLLNNNITAVIGNYALLYSFMQSILLQIITLHIYSELKIVIFTDEDKVADWNYMKFSPHCWDNQHEKRFIAATTEEKKKLSSYLENVFNERGMSEEKDDYKLFSTYYLVIVDNINTSRELGIINSILEMKGNSGFSLLIKNDRIANLPRQCTTFVNVTEGTSGVFETNLTEENQKQFTADFNRTVNIEDCVQKLSNIYTMVPKEKYELPKSIGFMEMYEVGNVEQFNSPMRWRGNNPIVSLGVPVGIDQNGNKFYMDIHEKAYGPHGLVAGTTGSGKSEWLITYILSLAINFSPLELQFVLIDYKGGGLAGSFENTETGMELPHLVGTITNLDKSEMRRSLASLESESKRRQRIFNEARDKLDDSSMDIYKYQQYYRKGLVDEPLSHLLIISDEFAELKSQEPEFLDSLVSIARVGRSLGIHLILATQKPAGVVTDQIWSNAKFKVCLKVQDKSDSMDMLKTPDAAFLRQTGSFYLQVGMNEVYTVGQSAYAGLKYQPTNIVKKKIDVSLDELDRSGKILNSQEIITEREENSLVHGEELLNIIKYLDEVAERQQINAKKLWLTPIPPIVFVDKLKKKYPFKREPYKVIPLIGEYDDPVGQQQLDYCLDLMESNVFIYGVQGSGKEMLIQSIIYSTMTSYTPQEVNFYIADFGAETLGVFSKSPHVGDVIYSSEMGKFFDLIKMVENEYVARRAKYREFGGNYESNNKYGKTKDPIMVVIINGYEFLKDDYYDVKEKVEKIMMDSVKYGIVFIISTVDKTSIKARVMTSLTNLILLHLNDDYEYRDILGMEAKGIIPKGNKGRGLFKRDKAVYEFQTATIIEEEKFQLQVVELCEKLAGYYKHRAKPIPYIPNPIDINAIDLDTINKNNICVGYSKRVLKPIYLKLVDNFSTLICSNKKGNLIDFCNVLYAEIDYTHANENVYLFDFAVNFKANGYKNIKYVPEANAKDFLFKLHERIDQEFDKFANLTDKKSYVPPFKATLILDSISTLNQNLTEEEKTKLYEFLEHAEQLHAINVIYSDNGMDLRMNYREKYFNKLLSTGNGILMDASSESQLFMDVSSKDVRTRDALLDNEAFVVLKNRAVYAQILRTEKIGSDLDEV